MVELNIVVKATKPVVVPVDRMVATNVEPVTVIRTV